MSIDVTRCVRSLLVIAGFTTVPSLHAQSHTAVELGLGAVAMRNRDGWGGPLAIAGQLGVRRAVGGSLEARVGVLGFHRQPGNTVRRITTVGLTGELTTPITRGGAVMLGGGVGLFAVDIYDRYFDDAVRISTGAVGLVGTVGSRHGIGGATFDLRLRLLHGDLGATGRTSVMLGLVFAP